MKKIINNKEVDAHEIEPLTTDEQFNNYQLPNGDKLRVKIVMTALYQSNETDEKGAWGYSFDFHPVVRIIKSKN